MSQKILITGASGAFGTLTTKHLLAQGHTVVASMRNPEGRNQSVAEELSAAGAHIIDMDVTDDASVTAGIATALEQAQGLDVLINNAGTGMLGIQEAFTAEDLQKVFDINVFGLHRVSRGVLPHFRAQHAGLLLNVSSLLGRMTIPFYGPYNASKWAVEALSENYRTEVSQFGVDVAVIEPGGFPTTFIDNLVKPSDKEREAELGEYANAPLAFLEGFEQALAANPAQKPQIVADAIAEVIAMKAGERPFRTVVDHMGMGEHLKGYNDHLHQVTEGIYTAFDIQGMLKLK